MVENVENKRSLPPSEPGPVTDRDPITLRVDYKRLNTFFSDYAKNISKGRTFVRTVRPLTIGTEFTFVLSLPILPDVTDPESKPAELTLNGVVQSVVKESDATPEKPAGMGIELKFAAQSDRQAVADFVHRLMTESLGEHLAKKLLATA